MNNNCKQCDKVIEGDYRKVFCNRRCYGDWKIGKNDKPKRKCLYCNADLRTSYEGKYCNKTCGANARQKQFIENWKLGLESGIMGKEGTSTRIRRYLYEKYESKCSTCGWNKQNPVTGNVPLQIEHINGHWNDNREENLELLCPNCHSLTPTFGSLNRGNGRKARYS